MGRTLLISVVNIVSSPVSARGRTRFVWGGGEDDDMNLGENFTWGHERKILAENEFSGNLNINFKIYPNYDDIHSFKRKLGKNSGKG